MQLSTKALDQIYKKSYWNGAVRKVFGFAAKKLWVKIFLAIPLEYGVKKEARIIKKIHVTN